MIGRPDPCFRHPDIWSVKLESRRFCGERHRSHWRSLESANAARPLVATALEVGRAHLERDAHQVGRYVAPGRNSQTVGRGKPCVLAPQRGGIAGFATGVARGRAFLVAGLPGAAFLPGVLRTVAFVLFAVRGAVVGAARLPPTRFFETLSTTLFFRFMGSPISSASRRSSR